MDARDVARILDLARGGRRVLVVSSSHDHSAAALEAILEHESNASQVRRARGAERITFESGGRILFVSVRSHAERGLTVDAVYYARDVEPTPELLDRYAPTVAKTSRGVFMHAERVEPEKISG